MERPVLRLGLAGFTPGQKEAIEHAAHASGAVRWICGALGGADAWLLSGAHTHWLGGGRIRVAPGVAGGRSVLLQIEGVRRPVAFSTPLPPTMEAPCTFDPQDPSSLVATLKQFEIWLAPTQAQFWLAAHIVESGERVGGGLFELRAPGELLAVVDMRGEAAVLPSLRPHDLDNAEWHRIRLDAKQVPSHFSRFRLEHLMWHYCSRTLRDVLPARYRRQTIYFRRPPRVEPQWVKDEHLVVLRELAVQPATFHELAERTALDQRDLTRVLGSLYYVGSITSNARRTGQTIQDPLTEHSTTGDAPSTHPDAMPQVPAYHTVPNYRELTAPAELR